MAGVTREAQLNTLRERFADAARSRHANGEGVVHARLGQCRRRRDRATRESRAQPSGGAAAEQIRSADC